MQYRTSSLGAALTLFLTIPAATAQDSRPVAVPGTAAATCSPEAIGWAGKDVTIGSVRWLSDPAPYCRIDGTVRTDDPGPNSVGFMIALPQSWNGRYLMVVPGGSAGYIVNPSREHISAGYAVASTDKGSHSTGALDMSFRADPGKSEDYAHRGAQVAALATQGAPRRAPMSRPSGPMSRSMSRKTPNGGSRPPTWRASDRSSWIASTKAMAPATG